VEGAIEDLTQAIRVDSHAPEAYVNRGLIRLRQGKKSEADRDFARSIALRPSLRRVIEDRIGQISQK
jgi:Flp pilus assembly protein TadD